MLAEALGAAFDGADWEASMAAFHHKRDQMMKPIYDATLDFTRTRDIGPARQAVLKALFISPATARALAHSTMAQLPSLLSQSAHAQTNVHQPNVRDGSMPGQELMPRIEANGLGFEVS